MSRCFPFPPPGYEKKARPDDVNLIIKEKHKEKKHKDKKDKEKKIKRNRKEKERTEGKPEENKDRKRKKHRDKKDKKKDKRHSSEEGSVVSIENQHVESVGPQSKPSDGFEDYMANGHFPRVDTRQLENPVVGNCFGESQGEVDNSTCQDPDLGKGMEKKAKSTYQNTDAKGDGRKKDNKDGNGKVEKKKRKEDKKKEKEKVRERSKELIKQNGSGRGFQDSHKDEPTNLLKGSHDDPPGDLSKCKKPELNGILHDNGIRPSNMSRPASSSHQVRSNQIGFDLDPPPNIVKAAVENGDVVKSHKPNGKLSFTQPMIENFKAQTVNNFAADHGGLNAKNHAANNGLVLLHQVNNGKIMEPCESTSSTMKVEDGAFGNHKIGIIIPSRDPLVENGELVPPHNNQTQMNKKDSGSNGVVLVSKRYVAESSSSASVITVEKDVKPHPDLKYLSKTLTVPDVEWPLNDDQDWLSGCKDDSLAKKPKMDHFAIVEKTEHVWAKAMHVECANLTALPYVIPY